MFHYFYCSSICGSSLTWCQARRLRIAPTRPAFKNEFSRFVWRMPNCTRKGIRRQEGVSKYFQCDRNMSWKIWRCTGSMFVRWGFFALSLRVVHWWLFHLNYSTYTLKYYSSYLIIVTINNYKIKYSPGLK